MFMVFFFRTDISVGVVTRAGSMVLTVEPKLRAMEKLVLRLPFAGFVFLAVGFC